MTAARTQAPGLRHHPDPSPGMDAAEISARLHDILRTACRVRQAGPGCTAEASVESIDQVKARLRALIADLGDLDAPRLPPQLQACASAFPEGHIAGTRATVQHRRRMRVAPPARPVAIRKAAAPTPRDRAEAHFPGGRMIQVMFETQHTTHGAGRPVPDDRYAARAQEVLTGMKRDPDMKRRSHLT